MELKKYQKQVLDDLSLYIKHLEANANLNTAWVNYWHDKNVPVGFGGVPSYKNTIAGVPNVCVKVPTGGGKTFIAASALKRIFDAMPLSKVKLVVWLVPSDSILSQTVKAFSNPEHDYHQRLERDFEGKVNIFTKDQLLNGQVFSPDAIEGTLSVCIFSYASLRINVRSADMRKVYQENGNLLRFAERFNDKSILLADTPDTALIQVLRQLNPVVIVDESHNAESDLSIEMLERLNPAFILDLTATPKENSNIISYVDARDLKKEHMVKLPVIVFNRKSVADVLQDGIILRNTLESKAIEAENNGGEYIRPIMLLQAQPNRNAESETYDKIKSKLLALGIPEAQIAIKTGDRDEIGSTDLLSKDCEIRYIITVNALKEGWDCPFAYILATVANRSSKVEVEQILGRILRQPYAKQHIAPILNTSYVFTSSADFNNTLNRIVEGLNRAGFSKKDYKVGNEDDITDNANEPNTRYELVSEQLKFNLENDASDTDYIDSIDIDTVRTGIEAAKTAGVENSATTMISQALHQVDVYNSELIETQNTGLIGGELGVILNQCVVQPQFAEDISTLKIPQFFTLSEPNLFSQDNYILLEKEHLNKGFTLAAQDANISFEFSASEMATVDIEQSGNNDVVPRYKYLCREESRYFLEIISHMPTEKRIEKCAELITAQINRNNRYSTKDLTAYVKRVISGMNSDDLASMEKNIAAHAKKIREKIYSLEDAHREDVFRKWIDNGTIITRNEYTLPQYITPIESIDSISKSLYSAELNDMNNFERSVLNKIVSYNNVKWWHRIIDRANGEFRINGFINHYPDFIVMTTRGNVLLIETKGDDRDNTDSKRKLKVGRAWQSQAENKFKYFMVYDNNVTGWDGAYTLDEFAQILAHL